MEALTDVEDFTDGKTNFYHRERGRGSRVYYFLNMQEKVTTVICVCIYNSCPCFKTAGVFLGILRRSLLPNKFLSLC